MFARARLRLAILRAALLGNVQRAVLAGAMVSMGIAAVVVMFGLSAGVRGEMAALQAKAGENLFVVRAAERPVPPWRGGGWFVSTRLKLPDAVAIERNLPRVRHASPIREMNVPVKLRALGLITMVRGVRPEFLELRRFELAEGRALDRRDGAARARVALVGSFIADRLNGGLSLVGETLWIAGIPFEVVGQLAPKGIGADGSNEDDQVLVPLETAMSRVSNVDYLAALLVQARGPRDVDSAMEDVRHLLRLSHRLEDDASRVSAAADDFDVLSMIRADEVRRLSSQWLGALARILAALTVSIGGAGIFAVSLLNVKDRSAEIGLRLALGATRASVGTLFISEACTISVFGGLAGLALGALLAKLLESFTEWALPLEARDIAVALVIAIMIGILFSAGPAWWAARRAPRQLLP